MKRFLLIVLILIGFMSNAQKLNYKSNGNVRDSENHSIDPDKMRELLADNEKLLAKYNSGRNKKTMGNFLLVAGPILIITDLLTAATTEKVYPTALTYAGVVALVIAIPVKIGFSRKIRNVVTDYNNQTKVGFEESNYRKLDLITNSKGIGLRLTLN